MIDKEKIVLLTRLAIYDKHMSESDKKINNYFLHDYIYARNLRTRFFAFIGSMIIILFYMMHRIIIEEIDIFALDYQKELTDIVIFIVIILVFYTIISSIQAAVTYKTSQKRIKAYLEVLKKAGMEKDTQERASEEAYKRQHGRDIIYTGSNYQRY